MLITDMGVSQLGEPSSITAALDRFFNCAQLEYFRYKLCTLTILLMAGKTTLTRSLKSLQYEAPCTFMLLKKVTKPKLSIKGFVNSKVEVYVDLKF